jgi:hypothetical protein
MLGEYSSQCSRYDVRAIKDHKKTKPLFGEPNYHLYEMLVAWEGYSSEHDTWEPLETLYEDAPEAVEDYFKSKQILPIRKRFRG